METRRIVMERAGNACERCVVSVVNYPGEIHHRKPRGMGGTRSKAINLPCNLVLLCSDCHRWVESNRSEARESGWLVRQFEAPETVPLTDIYGYLFLLDDDRRVDL